MARSPAYPAVGLGEAEELVGRIFEREQRTPVSEEVAVQAMGYAGLNGKTRMLLSALRKFGLLADVNGDVRVSELAMKLMHPADDQEREMARREAALQVDLFRDLVGTHLNASDTALRSALIRRGFTDSGAQQATASFRETVRVANLSESRYTTETEKGKEEMPTLTEEKPKARLEEPRGRSSGGSPTYIWPLPNGREVEIRVTDGGLNKGDLSFLRRYLEVVEDTLVADQPLPALAPTGQLDDDEEIDEGAL